MKKHPKLVQCDSRGQIVIPKDIRQELGIGVATGFYMYSISGEGILLKKIDVQSLDVHEEILNELTDKAEKIKVNVKNIVRAKEQYKKIKDGNLEII